MSNLEFKKAYEKYQKYFEEYLNEKEIGIHDSTLSKSIYYSLHAPGKRIRPVLLLMMLDSFGLDYKKGLAAGTAVEMVHTYSLIHDDLPAMDDDDLRRGQPSNHKKFNEATAILAGDSLLTEAFLEIAKSDMKDNQKVAIIQLLSEASGATGMCEGQQRDIEAENRSLSKEDLEQIHRLKTGKLFEYCVLSAGIIAETSEEENKLLKEYANNLGLAFQIRDDLLDIIGVQEELGKKVGSDQEIGKSTYPQLLGIQTANEYLNDRLNQAKSAVEQLSIVRPAFKKDLLLELANSLELEGVQ